jgi:hypothetical protein
MTGQEIPEEIVDPNWGPCPMLSDKECPVYGVRPFGCRCMVSKTVCAETGYADIEDLTLTVANLFNQFIEHLDQDGMIGNLIDVLLYLDHDKHPAATTSEKKGLLEKGLLPNRPIPVLMIPPEHREQMGPLLDSLKKVLEMAD